MKELSKRELSILIPVYNDVCARLVKVLHSQAEDLGIDYEIIVAEDGSSNQATIEQNREIEQMSHVRHLVRKENVGRAAIRNILAQQSHYAYLLFIDCDVTVPDSLFLMRYMACPFDTVVDGGVSIGGDAQKLKGNLRHIYEKSCEEAHQTACRQRNPYHDFRTTNFMARRSVMTAHPFDERFRHYGYEDVMFGKAMRLHHIPIYHIDNPLCIEDFEDNSRFMEKTEEGLRTLYAFRNELRGYNRLLTMVGITEKSFPLILVRWWHALFGRLERSILTSKHPLLPVYHLYRIGYYVSLKNNDKQ